MNRRHLRVLTCAAMLLSASVASGRIGTTADSGDVQLGIRADASLEFGQFVKYYYKNWELENQWTRQVLTNLTIDALIRDRIRIALGIEGKLWYNNFPKGLSTGQMYSVFDRNYSFTISEASGSYTVGDSLRFALSIAGGLFPYKYNPQVRNLGEYLFRSGVYPAYILGDFDFAFARLSGFLLSGTIRERLHQDLLLTMETDIHPFNDFTVSYLGRFSGGFLDAGWGVLFRRLLSVNDSITTPKRLDNAYITEDADTNYYTFRGTKLMARLTLDPKVFFASRLPGPEDFKLYAEAALLGVENYPRNDSTMNFNMNPYGYDALLQKIPVMVGINIPTFRILDVLAFEVEWYGCRYANNYTEVAGQGSRDGPPKPDVPRGQADYSADDWKWSVYLKKTFAGHLGVTAQVARDHIRTRSMFEETKDREEALSAEGHWWWVAKFFASF